MKIRWLPPATGEIKLNVDASIHSSERFGKVFEGWLRVVGRCQLQLLKFKIWLQVTFQIDSSLRLRLNLIS